MSALLRTVVWLLLALVAGSGAAQSDRGLVALSEGKNFRTIAQQPLADATRIEVIDFFFYGCPFCNDMRSMLESWRKQLPQDVVFRRVPTVRRDSWAPLARTYYTLEALGEVERLHEEVYKGYHDQELSMSRPEVMAVWAQRHGIDRSRWLAVYESDAVTRKVEQARKLTEAYDIQGTPSLVVDGRYLTSGGMTDDV
jgi:thiol:disulfide interchange protein DsbA